jgi:hypothetical protein
MLAIEDDLTCVDGLEAVVVTRPGESPASVAHALRRKIHHAEAAPSDGVYTADDVKWFLATSELASEPAPGTTIADTNGNVWTVLAASRDALTSAWRCHARRLSLTESRGDLGDILRAAWTACPAGDAAATWIAERTGVAARIQPNAMQVASAHEQRTSEVTHLIYLSERIELNANHRIVCGSATYHVVRSECFAQLDQWTVVHVRQSDRPLG